MNNRILYINILIFSFFVIIVTRLLYLYSLNTSSHSQNNDNKNNNNDLLKNNSEKFSSIQDKSFDKDFICYRRGIIRDKNGIVLAQDLLFYTLKADKKKLSNYNVAARSIAHIEKTSVYKIKKKYNKREILLTYKKQVELILRKYLNLSYEEIEKWRNNKKIDITVKKSISYDLKNEITGEFKKFNIVGFSFEKNYKRFYPYGGALAQVVGYVDFINNGKSGIESFYNSLLAYDYSKKESKDNFIEEPNINVPEIWLTIDAEIQSIVYDTITKAYTKYQADKIIAIFIDPSTGQILSMANFPSFNPNTKRGLVTNSANLSIQYLYDPGSVFKIVTAAAAVDNDKNKIDPFQLFYCHMGKYDNGKIKLTDHHPYYNLNLNQIIQKSSNIGIYKVAKILGKRTIYDYCYTFGFGRKTGIELSSEIKGLLKKPDKWTEHSLSRIPIGYEILTTPLQVAMSMSVIANNGILMKPSLIHKYIDKNKYKERIIKPKVARYVISKNSADKVKNALSLVVGDEGTAPLAKVDGYKVSGKTGTSRKIKSNKLSYHKNQHIVSFSGFLPYDNPKLLGLIVVDNPKSTNVEHYGGSIAAPIFREIAEKVIRIIEVKRALSSRQ